MYLLTTFVGLAYNIVNNEEFKLLLRAATGKDMAPLTRAAHDSYVDADFVIFCKKLSSNLAAVAGSNFGEPFVVLYHDMYLDNAGNAVVGASIAYIDQDWKLQHTAVMGQRHAGTHAALEVATAINTCFEKRYGLQLPPLTRFVMSDTTCMLLYFQAICICIYAYMYIYIFI